MIDRIKRWLAPPQFLDEVKTRRAGLSHAALLIMASVNLLVIVGNLLGGRTPLTITGLNGVMVIISLIAYAATKRGHIVVSSVVVLLLGLIAITAAAASLGTIRTPATALYLLLVIVAGLLFDLGGLIVMTLLCSGAVLGLIAAENAGLLPGPDYTVTVTQWVTYTVLFSSMGVLTHLALRVTRRALQRADAELAERTQAEAALKESSAQFRTLFEASPDAIVLIDPRDDWPILDCNTVACQMNGYTRDELIGQSIDILNVTPAPPAERAEYLEKIRQNGVLRLEALHRRKDRTLISIEVSTSLMTLEGREMVLGIDRDISERKRAEEQRRAAQELLDRVLASVPVGISIYNLETQSSEYANGTRVYAGRALDEFNMLTSEQRRAMIHPDDRANRAVFMHRLVALADGEVRSLEQRLWHTDGTWHWYHITYTPFAHSATGSITKLLSIMDDITERKRAEEALRESEERFRSLLQSIPTVSVQGYRADGITQYWNEASERLYGYPAAEAIGRNLLDLIIPPEMQADVKQAIQQMADTGQPIPAAELSLMRKDGSRVPVFSSHAIVQPSGRAPELFCLDIDLTERKQIENALRESESKFRAIIEQSAEGAVLVDERGCIIEWNRAQEQITGISRAEAMGQMSWDVQIRQIPLERRAHMTASTLRQNMLKMLESGQASQFERAIEVQIETPAGECKTILQTAFPIKTDRGYRLGSMVSDITTRKRMEDALVHRAHELTALHQTSLQINAQSDLTTLLHTIVKRQAELTDAQSSSVYLLEPDGQTVRKVVSLQADNQLDVVLRLGEGVAGRVAQTGQPFMVADYSAWEERPAVYADSAAHRTLGVPLRVGQRIIGALTVVDYTRTGPFTDETVQLVSLFADQAAIAIENARLMEAEHAQRQFAEALRDTAAALNSTLALNEVFDRILANVERIVPHEAANIMLIDDGIAHIVRHRGFAERGVEHLIATVQFRVEDVRNLRYMQATGQPLAIPDVHACPGWIHTPEIHWVNSHVAAPLRLKGQVIGFLNLDNATPNFYTPLHAERLQVFADQAALAVENARLFEAERARHRELETVYEASRQLIQSLDVTVVLDAISNAILQLTQADNVHIFLYDGEQLDFGSAMSKQGRTTVRALPRQDGLTYTAARSGETIFVEDTLHHPKYNVVASFTPPQLAIVALALKFETTVIGVMNVTYGQVHHFNEAERRVLNLLATQAATAIQNARLHQQVRDHAQQLEQRVADRTAELQAANLRLTELDRLKDEFLTRVSHELRTPLTSIKIYIELLETARPEKRDKYVQTLKREADRLHALIEEVLMFSQLNRYTRPSTLEPIDLNNLIEDRLTTWQKFSAGHDLAFRLNLAQDLPRARTDGELIVQALTRLIANAVNYTPTGSITVSTACADEGDQRWVTASVTDTGPGLTPDDLPHIFERFYRGHAAADYKTPGMGIGLSISREIAEKLGGRLTVETQVGVGSTFTLWLPVAE